MIIFHDPRCTEYCAPGHPERPERISRTVSFLTARHGGWDWKDARPASHDALLRAHHYEQLIHIRQASRDFDADTPAYAGIYDHAARAAGAAIDVANAAIQGDRAFSLMRPPGHHATRSRAMGFCYFNHVAVSALGVLATSEATNKGRRVGRVAIWDFDAHHGNGTEEILAGDDRIAFASIHQFPGYPGTGTRSFGNIHNFPVKPLTSRSDHVATVRRALDCLVAFKPDLLLVSAGFDAYAGDPITQMSLKAEDFVTFGRWLRETEIPAGAILEGGYSDDLPELIDHFLSSWDGKN